MNPETTGLSWKYDPRNGLALWILTLMCNDKQLASTTRAKWIHTAHWGAVTRLINQMDEALLATDVSKLKELSQSLKNKIDTLLKLDEELLVSVEEEELDHEMEQADIEREGGAHHSQTG